MTQKCVCGGGGSQLQAAQGSELSREEYLAVVALALSLPVWFAV